MGNCFSHVSLLGEKIYFKLYLRAVSKKLPVDYSRFSSGKKDFGFAVLPIVLSGGGGGGTLE